MQKVRTIEVKRCFVVSNLVKASRGKKRYLGVLTPADFAKRLKKAKQKVRAMSEKQLDRHITPEWPKRLRSYDACNWYVVTLNTKDLGVWLTAGGLPLAWTKGSLASTAKQVKHALEHDGKLVRRARHAIPNILASNVTDLQNEKYLLPIAFAHGIGTQGRRGLTMRVKADIDDGCMRSIALAVHGKKKIKLYFGIPKL